MSGLSAADFIAAHELEASGDLDDVWSDDDDEWSDSELDTTDLRPTLLSLEELLAYAHRSRALH